ncbi:MAG: transposase, partial [Bryobacteraceae bacterium]
PVTSAAGRAEPFIVTMLILFPALLTNCGHTRCLSHVGTEGFAGHHTVQHLTGEYARMDKKTKINVTTNTVESFFALLKRANYGIYHHMSRKYLGSYCAERDFVYNSRKLTDDQRTDKAIKAARGKRLMLRGPKGA